jgi:hypothetical protein
MSYSIIRLVIRHASWEAAGYAQVARLERVTQCTKNLAMRRTSAAEDVRRWRQPNAAVVWYSLETRCIIYFMKCIASDAFHLLLPTFTRAYHKRDAHLYLKIRRSPRITCRLVPMGEDMQILSIMGKTV